MLEPSAVNIGVWIGRQQAFSLMRGCSTLAQARALKEVRESRIYEALGLTWEEFCRHYAGISKRYADRIIRQLDENGEAYFRLSEVARVGPETFRQIAGSVTAETIEIDGEKVALSVENGPRIRAAIQKLRTQAPKPPQSAPAPSSEPNWQARFDAFIGELTRMPRATPEQRSAIRYMAGKAIHSISLLVKYMESAGEREPAA
jgi:hypothetical protein